MAFPGALGREEGKRGSKVVADACTLYVVMREPADESGELDRVCFTNFR